MLYSFIACSYFRLSSSALTSYGALSAVVNLLHSSPAVTQKCKWHFMPEKKVLLVTVAGVCRRL